MCGTDGGQRNPAVPDEGHNRVPVAASGVDTLGAVHPALEDFINGGVEVLDRRRISGIRGTGSTWLIREN